MALNDIYQIKVAGNLPNLELWNAVFWYQQTLGAGGTAAGLSTQFQNTVLVPLTGVLASNVSITSIQVLNTNLFSDNSIVVPVPPLAGTQNLILDVSQAIAFRKREGGVGTRYSYKRFPAPGAIDADRQWSNSGGTLHAQINTLAGVLGVVMGTAVQWTPVQVKSGWTMSCTAANPTYCGEGSVSVNGDLVGSWEIDRYASHQDTREESSWTTVMN